MTLSGHRCFYNGEGIALLQQIAEFFRTYTTLSVIARLIMAVICGGVIGNERGRHGRAAGLRTHALVCLGAAISAVVGLYTTEVLGYTNDPLRVGAQVISGIGFLGVGSILVVGQRHVRGLTTAAGLWATASIGLAAGVGYISVAVAATLIVMLTMTVMSRLEMSDVFESNKERYYLELSDMTIVNDLVKELKESYHATDVSVTKARSGVAGNLGIEVVAPLRVYGLSKEAITELQDRDGVVIAVQSW